MSKLHTTHISDAERRTTAIDNTRGYEAAVKRFEKRLGAGDIDGALEVVNSPNFREAAHEAAFERLHDVMADAKEQGVDHLRLLVVQAFYHGVSSASRLRRVELIATKRNELLAARVADLEARLAELEGKPKQKRTRKTT